MMMAVATIPRYRCEYSSEIDSANGETTPLSAIRSTNTDTDTDTDTDTNTDTNTEPTRLPKPLQPLPPTLFHLGDLH